MKSKNIIYIQEWMKSKPIDNARDIDHYYLKIANKIYQEFCSGKYQSLFSYYNEKQIKSLAILITSYFEDIISDTNIWFTFKKQFRKLYNKTLPFFNTSKDYYEDEINFQDLQFLIWYFSNTKSKDSIVNPGSPIIFEIAHDIIIILDDAFEYAPPNERLKQFYQLDEDEKDYYKVREKMDAILFKTYLFEIDKGKALQEIEDILTKSAKNFESMEDFNYQIAQANEKRTFIVQQERTKLLALKSNEWLAAILGEQHTLHNPILNLSKKVTGLFFYKGQDKSDVFIEHIASSMPFKMTKDSFDQHYELEENDTIIYVSIIKWMNEWWFSGVYVKLNYDADLILDEKNSAEKRADVNFLKEDQNDMQQLLTDQLNAFKKFNGNKQIAFLPTNKINEFCSEFINFFNESLNLNEKEITASEKRAKADGYFPNNNNENFKFEDNDDGGIVFFNPAAGVEFTTGITPAFLDDDNPFYDEKRSEQILLFMLATEDVSKELVLYFMEHYKHKTNFFEKNNQFVYLNDFDFMLRFWKANIYHTSPKITSLG